MQPMRQLERVLRQVAGPEHYLFSSADLLAAVPGHRDLAVLLSRAQAGGLLTRVCRGIYLYDRVDYPRGRVLFHAAALLRASEFNYISLETALSDLGVISQVPIDWITLMSSGRSHVVDCGRFGHIEFVHTTREANDLAGQLTYDTVCRLWRASRDLALRDMHLTRRNMDLVNAEVLHESA